MHFLTFVLLGLLSIFQCACGNTTSATVAETIVSVAACADGASCTLTDALTQAQAVENPVIQLPSGTYEISSDITFPVTIESATSAASVSLLPKNILRGLSTSECRALELTSQPTFDTIIQRKSDSDGAVLHVNLTNAENQVVIKGVKLKGDAQHAALQIESGHVSMDTVALLGGFHMQGKNATASMTNVAIKSLENAVTLNVSSSDHAGADAAYVSADACGLAALQVTNGAVYTGINVDIGNHTPLGVCVSDAQATFCGGHIHDMVSSTDGGYGRGAEVIKGGDLKFIGTLIENNHEIGVLADGTGTALHFEDAAVVRKTALGRQLTVAVGVATQSGATLSASALTINGVEGPGLYFYKAAASEVANTTLDGNTFAQMIAYASTVKVDDSVIQNTGKDISYGYGAGIYIDNAKHGGSTITIDQTTVRDNLATGILVKGDGGAVTISNSTITGSIDFTLGNFSTMGQGIFVWDVCSGLTLSGNTISGNKGPQVHLYHAYATMDPNTYVTNAYYDFVQSQCTDCVTTLSLADLYSVGLSASDIVQTCESGSLLVNTSIDFSLGLNEVEPKE